MKKTIFICATFVFFLIIGITGCKKNLQQEQDDKNKSAREEIKSQSWDSKTITPLKIRVSSYGFLVFPDVEDLDEYRSFLLSSTHNQVQEYLFGLGFKSVGAKLYGEEYASQIVTEEQSVNYIFNADQVFQVQNVIMKPIGETSAEVNWQFLLTMTPEYLTNSTYETLAAGKFDPNSMDKFATNAVDKSRDMFEFIAKNPFGYEEIEVNPTQRNTPMFGTIKTEETICEKQPYYAGSGNCVVNCKKVNHVTTYIFWVGFHRPDEILGTWQKAATGC